jgi:hypothetical protein
MSDNENPTTNLERFGITQERVEKNQQAMVDVIAKYYGDPDYKAEVDADPTAVLKAEGVEIPEGATVKLLFNSETVWHIVVPHEGALDASKAAGPES